PGLLPFELLVSHVCRLWRNVTLGTSSLWTSITALHSECPLYECVVAYLERSKSHSLDIRIDYTHGEVLRSSAVKAGNFEVLTLLIPHLARWASIWLGVRCYHYMYTFLEAVSDPSIPPATRLEELQLGPLTPFSEPKFLDHFTLFGGIAPLLRTLVLVGVHIDWSQGWLQSAPNLQTLHLTFHDMDVCSSWAAFSTILRGAPALRTFKIDHSGSYNYPGELLSCLACWNLTSQQMILILRKLCTPVLKTLTLGFSLDYTVDYCDFIMQLVGPATQAMPSPIEQPCSLLKSLETLSMEGLVFNEEPDCAEMIYRELVNLKVFKLSVSPALHWSFVELLFPRRAPAVVLLPSLKKLSISGVASYYVVQLVVERRDAGVPLSAIFMKQCYGPTKFKHVVWLRDNLEEFNYRERFIDSGW
ncbi:hypothetical protein SCLCIDRAFT_135157, partial [Scleroderma citrinum Foug A]